MHCWNIVRHIFILGILMVNALAVQYGFTKWVYENLVSGTCSPSYNDSVDVHIDWLPLYCLLFLYHIKKDREKLLQENTDCACESRCTPAYTNPSTADCKPCSTDCPAIMQIKANSTLKCNCVVGSDVVMDSLATNMSATMMNTTTMAPDMTSATTNSTGSTNITMANMNSSECECNLFCLPRVHPKAIPPCVYTVAILNKLKSPNNNISCDCGIDRGAKIDKETSNPIFKCICSKEIQN